jgi:hypothetical protein
MRHLCTLANLRDFAAVAGYDLGVHTALKPLKMGKRRHGGGAIGTAPSGLEADSEERALPGGVGTFSIRQAPSTTSQPRGEPTGQGVVRGAFAPVLQVARTDAGTHVAESGARAHSGPATMWQDSGTDQRSRGDDSLESFSSCSELQWRCRHVCSVQNSDPDCPSACAATRGEGRSSGSSGDQGPNTPRSKHSATEQRRRTKINDRQASSTSDCVIKRMRNKQISHDHVNLSEPSHPHFIITTWHGSAIRHTNLEFCCGTIDGLIHCMKFDK